MVCRSTTAARDGINTRQQTTKMKKTFLLIAAFGTAVFLTLAGPSWAAPGPPALAYKDQFTTTGTAPTFIHSGICTRIVGQVVWDNQFAEMVKKNVGANYNEIAFDFNECYGGGMLDELGALGLTKASFTSAARYDQQSVAGTLDPATGGK